MCPIVPTLMCGLFLSNFCLDIYLSPSSTSSDLRPGRLSTNRCYDLFGNRLRYFLVRRELHRVGGASLGPAAQLRRVAEHLRERHLRLDDSIRAPLVHGLDPPTASG